MGGKIEIMDSYDGLLPSIFNVLTLKKTTTTDGKLNNNPSFSIDNEKLTTNKDVCSASLFIGKRASSNYGHWKLLRQRSIEAKKKNNKSLVNLMRLVHLNKPNTIKHKFANHVKLPSNITINAGGCEELNSLYVPPRLSISSSL